MPSGRSRQRSVVALRRLLNERVRPRNVSLYEQEGLPAFTARHGHAPRDAAEVNEALFDSAGYRLWSALNRSAQELIWMATGEPVLRESERLEETARRLMSAPQRRGELHLDPSFVPPAEIAGIDIGRKFAAVFAGERAPTLADVIALVRGRMRINVELKYNVPDPGLAQAVVDLLRRERFLDQVVITSLDYEALREIERIEPDLQTGHIVTAAVGDIVRSEADFLSLNSARATPLLIRRAHAAGNFLGCFAAHSQRNQ